MSEREYYRCEQNSQEKHIKSLKNTKWLRTKRLTTWYDKNCFLVLWYLLFVIWFLVFNIFSILYLVLVVLWIKRGLCITYSYTKHVWHEIFFSIKSTSRDEILHMKPEWKGNKDRASHFSAFLLWVIIFWCFYSYMLRIIIYSYKSWWCWLYSLHIYEAAVLYFDISTVEI